MTTIDQIDYNITETNLRSYKYISFIDCAILENAKRRRTGEHLIKWKLTQEDMYEYYVRKPLEYLSNESIENELIYPHLDHAYGLFDYSNINIETFYKDSKQKLLTCEETEELNTIIQILTNACNDIKIFQSNVNHRSPLDDRNYELEHLKLFAGDNHNRLTQAIALMNIAKECDKLLMFTCGTNYTNCIE